MSEFTKQIGRQIASYRDRKGYTHERLADAAGVSTISISQIEEGEEHQFKGTRILRVLVKISEALDVPLDELVAWKEKGMESEKEELVQEIRELQDRYNLTVFEPGFTATSYSALKNLHTALKAAVEKIEELQSGG